MNSPNLDTDPMDAFPATALHAPGAEGGRRSPHIPELSLPDLLHVTLPTVAEVGRRATGRSKPTCRRPGLDSDRPERPEASTRPDPDERGEVPAKPEDDWDPKSIKARLVQIIEDGDPNALLADRNFLEALALYRDRQPDEDWAQLLARIDTLLSREEFLVHLPTVQGEPGQGGAPNGSPDPERIVAVLSERGIRYREQDGWICLERGIHPNGTPEVTPLAPFVARIEQRIFQDDGQESRLFFRIAGTRCDKTTLPTLELPAEEFQKVKDQPSSEHFAGRGGSWPVRR